MDSIEDVRRRLVKEDADFRRMAEEHHQHETRLAALAQKRTLSPEEEFEEKTLKKRKLALKDQMTEKLRSYEATHSV